MYIQSTIIIIADADLTGAVCSTRVLSKHWFARMHARCRRQRAVHSESRCRSSFEYILGHHTVIGHSTQRFHYRVSPSWNHWILCGIVWPLSFIWFGGTGVASAIGLADSLFPQTVGVGMSLVLTVVRLIAVREILQGLLTRFSPRFKANCRADSITPLSAFVKHSMMSVQEAPSSWEDSASFGLGFIFLESSTGRVSVCRPPVIITGRGRGVWWPECRPFRHRGIPLFHRVAPLLAIHLHSPLHRRPQPPVRKLS